MRLKAILLLTSLILAGCSQVPAAVAPATTPEASVGPAAAERALQKSLDEVLEQSQARARGASTAREAERQAQAVFAQWAKQRREELQFQVQAMPLPNDGLQLQMQAQTVMGEQTVQVQRQWVVRPFPAR